MGKPHLVQIGLMGVFGRYDAPDFRCYDRNARVICRTHRGLEVGTVLCELPESYEDPSTPTGDLLRQTGREDELILERLERYRDKAFTACNRLLDQRGISATLMDVEHLFDGQSIYFYFLGEVTPQLEAVTSELTETYEQKVRFRKFAQTLAEGCGPTCGTQESGCSSGGCGSCALAGSCGAKR